MTSSQPSARSSLTRNTGFGICLSLCFSLSGKAQKTHSPASEAATTPVDKQLPVPLTLRYEDPVTFPAGTTHSHIFGDFKCDVDGTVYVPLGDVSPSGKTTITVTALTTSNEVVRFLPTAVDGYKDVIPMLRYYVSPSNVYLLALGFKVDPMDGQKTIGSSRFVQVFDHKGNFVRTVILDPNVEPINLAAFPSGDMLLFATDKLNHTTRLHLLDAAGNPESQLGLFDNDFAAKLDGLPDKKKSI